MADLGPGSPQESAKYFKVFGPIEVVFNNGRFLAGVHEAADTELAAKAVIILNEALKTEVRIKK